MDDIVKYVHNIPIQALTMTIYSFTLVLWAVSFYFTLSSVFGGDIVSVENLTSQTPPSE
jgi:hypothetical protein